MMELKGRYSRHAALLAILGFIRILECKDVSEEPIDLLNTPVSGEDWYKCRGYNCNIYKKYVLDPMFQYKKALAEKDGEKMDREEPTMDDGMIGDVYVNPFMAQELLESVKPRQKRKLHVTGLFQQKWDLPIHYEFDGNHTREEQNRIRAALQHWEAQTCIRFKDVTGQRSYRPRIIFIKNVGCASYIGYYWVMQGQPVDLVTWCTLKLGTIAHEIGHVIGFWHEHQRSDRDSHVTIHRSHVRNGLMYYNSIIKVADRTRNWHPYDYTSVMHYHSKSGTEKGKVTVETKDPMFQRTIGQAVELSFFDVKVANMEYCSKTCAHYKLPYSCKHGGYQDPNDCTRCKCPDGFGGRFCTRVQESNAACGGDIYLSHGQETTIQSPYYYGRGYSLYNKCNWRIRAPPGEKVRLVFEGDFGIYCTEKSSTCYHWVEVKYKSNKEMPGPRFCCQDRPSYVLQSESETMIVTFRANFSYGVDCSRHGVCRGFRAKLSSGSTYRPPVQTPKPTPRAIPTQRPTKPPTPPPTQNPSTDGNICGRMDLAFVLDSSGKPNGRNDWRKMLSFVKDFSRLFRFGDDKVHAGVVSYGNRGTLSISLGRHNREDTFSNYVNDSTVPFKDQMTNIADGLRVMRTELFNRNNGDRSEAPDVAILLSEGPANKEEYNTIREADQLRELGIKVFVIGISGGVRKSELEEIATEGSTNYVMYVPSFDRLQEAKTDLYNMICQGNPDVEEQTDPPSRTTSRKTTTSTTVATTILPTVTPKTNRNPPPPRPSYPGRTSNGVVREEIGRWSNCSKSCGGCGWKYRMKYCIHANGLRSTCGREEVKCSVPLEVQCSCCKFIGIVRCEPGCTGCCEGYRVARIGRRDWCVPVY